MHIAHVNLAKGFRGGERQTLLLCQHLATQNIQQTLIVRHDSPLAEQAKEIANLKVLKTKRPHFKASFGLKADLIHAHEAKACHFAYLNYVIRKTPYIVTRRVPNWPKGNRFTRNIYRNASACVAISSAIKRALEQYSPGLNVHWIPSMCANFTPDEHLVQALKKQYQGRYVVGHIGALENRHKGQSYLIEAAQELTQRHPDMLFLLLGEGSDRGAFEEAIGSNPNIKLLGFKENVANYLYLFDCFAFPSLQEGLGSTLLDAMQAKLPMIGSNVDGIPDIIQDQHNGLLIPPGDSQAIVKAIETLYDDRQLAKQYGEQGYQQVEQFKPEAISERYYQLYQQRLNETNP